MKSMQKIVLGLIFSVLAATSSAVLAAGANRMVAIVNNDVITTAELDSRTHIVALNLRRQNIALPPMEQLRSQVLQQLIFDKIVDQ